MINLKRRGIAGLCSILILSAAPAFAAVDVTGVTGATVTEIAEETLFVSSELGNDRNPGTEAKPFKTLGRTFEVAGRNLAAGISTKIRVLPGIYREPEIRISGKELGGSALETPLIIEGPEVGTAVIKGSEVVTDWKLVDRERGIYRRPWSMDWGDAEVGNWNDGETTPDSPVLSIEIQNGARNATLRCDDPSSKAPARFAIYRRKLNTEVDFQKVAETSRTTKVTIPEIGDDDLYRVRAIGPDGKEGPPSNAVRLGWSANFIQNRVGRRQEMVFVGGQLLHQVESKQGLGVGRFYIDDGDLDDPDDGFLYVQIIPFYSIDDYITEVATRGYRDGLITIVDKNNVIVRGLSFQHAASHIFNGGALRVMGCSNVLLEDIDASWNNGFGIVINVTNRLTLRRNRCSDNGGCGIGGGTGINQIWENVECRRNGWRGILLGGEEGFFTAGIKFGFGLRDAIFRDSVFEGNHSIGFWLDTDVENALIENITAIDNLRAGILLEAIRGPVLVRDCEVTGNRRFGVRLGDVGNTALEDNYIVNNFPDQIKVGVLAEDGMFGRKQRNYYTGEEFRCAPVGNSWSGNIIAALDSSQRLVSFEWGNLPSYMEFCKNLQTKKNRFWHPTTLSAFRSPLPGGIINLTLDQWTRLIYGENPEPDDARNVWAPPPKVPSAASDENN